MNGGDTKLSGFTVYNYEFDDVIVVVTSQARFARIISVLGLFLFYNQQSETCMPQGQCSLQSLPKMSGQTNSTVIELACPKRSKQTCLFVGLCTMQNTCKEYSNCGVSVLHASIFCFNHLTKNHDVFYRI